MFRSPSSPASTIFVVLNWPHGFWTGTTKLRREFSHELLSQQIVSWARMWQLAISVPIVAVCQIWGRAQPIPYQHRPLQGWFGFLWHDFPQARFHSLLNQLFRALMLVGSKRDPTFHLSSKFLWYPIDWTSYSACTLQRCSRLEAVYGFGARNWQAVWLFGARSPWWWKSPRSQPCSFFWLFRLSPVGHTKKHWAKPPSKPNQTYLRTPTKSNLYKSGERTISLKKERHLPSRIRNILESWHPLRTSFEAGWWFRSERSLRQRSRGPWRPQWWHSPGAMEGGRGTQFNLFMIPILCIYIYVYIYILLGLLTY